MCCSSPHIHPAKSQLWVRWIGLVICVCSQDRGQTLVQWIWCTADLIYVNLLSKRATNFSVTFSKLVMVRRHVRDMWPGYKYSVRFVWQPGVCGESTSSGFVWGCDRVTHSLHCGEPALFLMVLTMWANYLRPRAVLIQLHGLQLWSRLVQCSVICYIYCSVKPLHRLSMCTKESTA